MSSSLFIKSKMQSVRVSKAIKPVTRSPICMRAGAKDEFANDSTPINTSQGSTIFYAGNAYTEAEWSKAVQSGKFESAQPVTRMSSADVAVSATPASITGIMAFNGTAPEITNGRLAMLGFVSAVAAELATGEGVLRQLSDEPTLISLTFILFVSASLVPLLAPKPADQQLGPFTRSAEMLNGRAAMIGFAALLAVEAAKGSALF